MSLFQCYECGCQENTATCNFWSRMNGQWRGIQLSRGCFALLATHSSASGTANFRAYTYQKVNS